MTSVTTEHDENGSILLCMYVICRAKTSTALHCTALCRVKSNQGGPPLFLMKLFVC